MVTANYHLFLMTLMRLVVLTILALYLLLVGVNSQEICTELAYDISDCATIIVS